MARLEGVDTARALALFGMMSVHVIPTQVAGSLTWAHEVWGGRAAALFAVLAGVGIALATGGPSPPVGAQRAAARRSIAARSGVVALVGLTLASLTPVPIAIILPYYGVLFLLALPVLGWPARRLAIAAAVSLLLAPVMSHALRLSLPYSKGPSTAWADLVLDPAGTVVLLLLGGYYPVLTWSAYLFIGLAAGRTGLATRAAALNLVAVGAGLAVAGWAAGRLTLALAGTDSLVRLSGASPGTSLDVALHTTLYGTTPTNSWWWLGVQAAHLGSAPDLLHTGGAALAVLGCCLAVSPRLGPLRRPLVAAGSMTLTLYCLHVLLVGSVEQWWGEVARPGFYLAVQITGAIVLALAWGSPRRRGPLEALAHSAAAAAGRNVIGAREKA